MTRIERIGPREGSVPVPLVILSPLEREQQREERERRRRQGAPPAAPSSAAPAAARPAGSDEPAPRLDLRA